MSLTLAEANQVVQGALAKAKEMNIRISVAVCDAGGRSDGLQSHGRRAVGRGLRLPGQGHRVGRLRAPERRAGRTCREPDHPGHRRRRGRPHDPEPGRGARSSATAWWTAPAASAAAPPSKTKTAPAPESPSSAADELSCRDIAAKRHSVPERHGKLKGASCWLQHPDPTRARGRPGSAGRPERRAGPSGLQ